jgi:hypothetical protein
MSTPLRQQGENPTGRNRPYHGTWAKQFPSPAPSTPPGATPATKPESTEAMFARQQRIPSAPSKPSEPARDVWNRQLAGAGAKPPSTEEVFARQHASKPRDNRFTREDGTPIPTHEVFARQFAPKPAAVPPRAAIPQTFATSRQPGVAPLGVKLNGLKGSVVTDAIAEVRRLIAAGGVDNLVAARDMLQHVPKDHPEGWSLVKALFKKLCEEMEMPTPVT